VKEIIESWRRWHHEKLHALYSSPIIIRATKSRRMRWAGHVARVGNRRGAYRVSVGDLREGEHLEDVSVNGNNIKLDLKQVGKGRMDRIDMAQDKD
jgi:hypothetical protein